MQSPDPPDDDEDDERRRRNNVLVLAVTAIIVVLGIWLVNKFIDMRNVQNCLESGRRNCAPVSQPER
jgi:cytochrome oxidase assembly protein ShyY1